MFGLTDWLKIGAGAALGALIASGPVYVWGKLAGAKAERVAQLEASVEAYIERNAIDETVDDLGRVDICIDLGGLPDDCGELRGLDEAAQAERPGVTRAK